MVGFTEQPGPLLVLLSQTSANPYTFIDFLPVMPVQSTRGTATARGSLGVCESAVPEGSELSPALMRLCARLLTALAAAHPGSDVMHPVEHTETLLPEKLTGSQLPGAVPDSINVRLSPTV